MSKEIRYRQSLIRLETFLLFSQTLPSQDLGFMDSRAGTIELTVAGRDLTIHQSPTLLSSNRKEGTTGAVLWRVSPLFAEWISSLGNCLFAQSVLRKESLVLELGCGVSGIVALALASQVNRYIATDQDYVLRLLKQNIEENTVKLKFPKSAKKNRNDTAKSAVHKDSIENIQVIALDWEHNSIESLPSLLGDSDTVDAVIACDCIYNEALISPFVRACSEICRLRIRSGQQKPTVCLVAQQLRSPDIFDAWAKAFYKVFKFWRVPDELLIDGLRIQTGFVVHLGILRNSIP